MKRIGLLSDTHGFLDETIFRHFEPCDEIWHAGDFGSFELAEKIKAFKPLLGVFGNIDGREIRNVFPEKLRFKCEEVEVFITHIGGSPPKYQKGIRKEMIGEPARLFICGHSHILKIKFDDSLQCLYMNPGAAGKQGWHTIRTIIRFNLNAGDILDCEVIELGRK
jgi:uncharacterized protein